MSIRIPNSPVLDITSVLATATADLTNTCLLPQDTDSIAVFVWAPTFGLTTSDLYFQTSPDGGANWYDMGNVQITAAVVQQNARVATFNVIAAIERSSAGVNSAIGACAASTVGANLYSGCPIMGRNFRVAIKTTGTGASTVRCQVFVQNQSNRA